MRKTLLFLLSLPVCAGAADAFDCAADGARLQQLRIYEVNRTNREPFHQRFQDHALRIMKKYGFNVVDMWESETGEKLQLVYVLDWPDRDTMDSAWKAFLADAEWIDIKKRSAQEHGQLVVEAKGQPLVRLSYSPACKRTAEPTSSSVPADLAARVRAYDVAQVKGDKAALEDLLADDFVLVNSRGERQTKAQLIADYTKPGFKLEPFVVEEAVELVWSDGAVMGGVARIRGVDAGQAYDLRLRFSDMWAKRDGKWRVVYVHASRD